MFRYAFLKVLQLLLKVGLSLRYKIDVKGREVLKDPRLQGKGVLVLPNHTAEVEPFMIMMLLGADFNLKPLVTESYYYYPFARFFMKLVGAKPVPEFDRAVNDYKLKKAEELFHSVVTGLDSGQHVLLYPSAGLKDSGKEKIGGRSLAHATIQETKNTEILLVRVTGLWGSLFSKAYTKETPDFWTILFKGIFIGLRNLIFFTPRRGVTIEFSLPDQNFPKNGTRMEFNRALEKFYNHYQTKDGKIVDSEALSQVPYSFLSKRVPEVPLSTRRTETMSDLFVPNHIRQDIMYQLSELSEKSVKEIDDYQDLVQDVGLDSLNIASLYSYLETHYDIDRTIEPVDLKTVQDLFKAAMHVKGDKKGGRKEEKSVGKSSWPRLKKSRPDPKYPNSDSGTLIETFLRQCDRMGNHAATTDMATGVMTFAMLKRTVVILSRKIEKMEGDYIAIMLPSSNAANLFVLATMLAGKVPVPLNWTVGPYFMNHAIDLMEIKHVITSARFLQRLDSVDLGKAIDKFVLAEDLKASLTLMEKLSGALLAKRSARKILEKSKACRIRENDTAVVLFTSGTTALPKSVPLSHKNILSNQKCAVDSIDLNTNDVIMMALPPFHVFGLTVGLLPILTGARVVFSPDPLDGATIAREILKWRVTMIVLAPTFFSHLFRVATLSQLKSIRLFVSGAEKAPESLMNFVTKLGGDVWFVEGYGLTETSPIISVNQIYSRPRGVGKVLPSLKLAIIDPESKKKLDVGQIGEVCVAGDSIFRGYYKQDNTDYFVTVDGESYFRTGDLGHTDEENYLYLQGRMKLSFKRGGEMINVVAIESAILQKAKEKGWVAFDINHSPFACVPREMPTGTTKVVLFTEIPLTLEQVNAALIEAGFSRLYKVSEVKIIDQIPMLKSGKVCLRKLFELLSPNGTQSPSK